MGRPLILQAFGRGVHGIFCGGNELVKCRDVLSRADLPGVFAIVIEVAVGHDPVFIADQPKTRHLGRVEFDLDLHVLGNGHQGGTHFPDQHLVRFFRRVDVGVMPIALVREPFQVVVLEVAHAETEHAQKDAAAGLGLDELVSSSWLETPTLKSPSVARITRFVPFLMKFWAATS